MNEINEKLKRVREERMRPDELASTRERLVSFMESYEPKRIPSMLSRYPKRTTAALIASGLFALTSGISYAAEGALPGDTLYPVKVNINEKVASALAVTPEAKADFERKEVERRAEEAEALAKKNELNDKAKMSLAESSSAHLDSFIKVNAQIALNGDEKNAKRSENDMKRTMHEHKKTFAALGVKAAISFRDDDDDLTASTSSSTISVRSEGRNAHGVQSDRNFNQGHERDEDTASSSLSHQVFETNDASSGEEKNENDGIKIEVPRTPSVDTDNIEHSVHDQGNIHIEHSDIGL